MSAVAKPATVQQCLRVGTGFSQGDRNWIAEQFGTLNARLASFHADATELEISVKDREARGQKVTLECRIGVTAGVVATRGERPYCQQAGGSDGEDPFAHCMGPFIENTPNRC